MEKIYELDCAIWEITLACNMNCKHCGSSAGIARENELNTKESYILCEALAETKCNVVSLMGGEPFVRKDWHLIAECIKDLGMDLALVSNGLLIPREIDIIDRLETLVVGISLDGMEKNHDMIRKKGAYKSAIKAIDLLTERNIQTTVITTLTKENFFDLPKLRNILIDKNVNWQIQVGVPFGNLDPNLVIDKEEYYASAMFIASESIKNKFEDMPVVGAHCYGYNSYLLPTGKKWSGCTAGISTVGITSDGSIVGCLSMGNDQFLEGNVRNLSFIDIWENPNSFSYNRHFNKKDLGKNCQGCYYGSSCKGGCNSVSFHLTGQFHNSPLCLRRIEETILDVKLSKREKIAHLFFKSKNEIKKWPN